MTRWKNNKTGEVYCLLAQATDCTNSRDGTPVILYYRESDPAPLYIRELREFDAKFTQISNEN